MLVGLFPGESWIGDSRVYVTNGLRTDSVDVDAASGLWVIQTDMVLTEPLLKVIVDERQPAQRHLAPSIAVIDSQRFARDQRFVRVPLTWLIRRGTYQDTTVAINLQDAYSPTDPYLEDGFYGRTRLGGAWVYRALFIPSTRTPLPVFLDHARSDRRLSAADDSNMWTGIDSLQTLLGELWFTPRTYPTPGVVVYVDSALFRDLGTASAQAELLTNQEGEIVGGTIAVRYPQYLASSALIAHELMHIAGFGHTCMWASIMNVCKHAPAYPYPVTARDAAYAELYYAVQQVRRTTAAQYGLPEAHQGQRVLMLGLPLETIQR